MSDALKSDVVIYVDGACRGNPGPGGWGSRLEGKSGQVLELCGGENPTTNNRMELTAAIRALQHLPSGMSATLYTDSNYVKQGISEWIHGWKRKHWRKSDGQPVINADLWKLLDELTTGKTLQWHWIKGHAGHPGNERADQLANQGVDALLQSVAPGSKALGSKKELPLLTITDTFSPQSIRSTTSSQDNLNPDIVHPDIVNPEKLTGTAEWPTLPTKKKTS